MNAVRPAAVWRIIASITGFVFSTEIAIPGWRPAKTRNTSSAKPRPTDSYCQDRAAPGSRLSGYCQAGFLRIVNAATAAGTAFTAHVSRDVSFQLLEFEGIRSSFRFALGITLL